MTKLTTNQRATIVRLFASGTTLHDLAVAYQAPIAKIEQIVREAMLKQPCPE